MMTKVRVFIAFKGPLGDHTSGIGGHENATPRDKQVSIAGNCKNAAPKSDFLFLYGVLNYGSACYEWHGHWQISSFLRQTLNNQCYCDTNSVTHTYNNGHHGAWCNSCSLKV